VPACTHGPSRKKNCAKARSHRYRRIHSGLSCAVVYGLYALPGEPTFATVAGHDAPGIVANLSACMGAPGPHDFARPRTRRSSVSTFASTASPPRACDDRDAPLLLEAGWARGYFRFTEISRVPRAADWHDEQFADGWYAGRGRDLASRISSVIGSHAVRCALAPCGRGQLRWQTQTHSGEGSASASG
jgi:hypothetical protein